MNAPEFDATADVTPVTVWMSPAQSTQFEVLLAHRREEAPDIDENKLCDEIFARGLKTYGCRDEAEILHDMEVATAAYIAELLERIAVLEAHRPISTPECVRHLQDLMVGTGSCIAIEDGEFLVEVTMEPAGEAINVQPEDLVELVDALTTIQNFREQA